jgi:long-chain acyl-CoA synthetase
MVNGITITYAESVDKFRDNIGEVRPHFFTTVPRLLEKAYERIVTAGIQSGGLKKSIFMWAIGLTDSYAYDDKGGFLQKIADKIVYSKIRERLGGNLKGIFTGAAACPAKIARVFSAAGVPVREGYGLTETSPAIALNCFVPFRAMLGTVGPVIDGVEVKIAEDGEILAKGPNIMMGYYKHPDKTAEVMSEGGWFHTGDIGTLVENSKGVKFLKITDRKKELLKTSGGKYVAPAPIEALCKESFYIEQMMILGEAQKFVAALIVPSFENLEIWAKEQGITYSSRQDLCKNPKVIALFDGIIKEYNPNFSHIEQIKKFELLADEWTIDSGELTPTMKLKRRVVSDKYKVIIDKIYA